MKRSIGALAATGGWAAALLLIALAFRHEVAIARAESGLARACPPRAQWDSARAHRGPATASAVPLARTGVIFASHSVGRRVSIVDVATGEITTLPAGIDDPHEVGVSPDGRWGVAADFGNHTGNYEFDGRRLAVFDLRAKRLARVIDLGTNLGPHDVVFAPDAPARAYVTTQTTRNVVEVDVATGEVLGAIPTNARASHNIALSADGARGFTANQLDGSISVLDLRSRALVARHTIVPHIVEGIATTPDGREVWLGSRADSSVRIVDAGTGAVLARLTGFRNPERMQISPDGRRAMITDFGCRAVRVVDVASRRELGPIAGLEGAGVGKFFPGSRLALIATTTPGSIVIADLDEMRVIARFELGRRADAAAWGPRTAR